MPPVETDFIIVGQGLAGSILAYCLMQSGYSVMVIDDAHKTSSSAVAAGIINPITGHRLNITENFYQYWTAAKPFYQDLEKTLSCRLLETILQTRLIKNAGQNSHLQKRLLAVEYQGLIKPCDSNPMLDRGFGAVEVNETAAVDVNTLLENIQGYLRQNNSYTKRHLVYAQIVFDREKVSIAPHRAKNIVFCEGYQAINNPWLNKLPFKLAKGEVLTLDMPRPAQPQMLNWENWLLKSSGGTKLGASYEWQDLSLSPNDEVRAKLLNSLSTFTSLEPRVINHQVGVRPTTLHRTPFIGRLSTQPNAYCFNGFGSKGCLTIPYYAALFSDSVHTVKNFPSELTKWL